MHSIKMRNFPSKSSSWVNSKKDFAPSQTSKLFTISPCQLGKPQNGREHETRWRISLLNTDMHSYVLSGKTRNISRYFHPHETTQNNSNMLMLIFMLENGKFSIFYALELAKSWAAKYFCIMKTFRLWNALCAKGEGMGIQKVQKKNVEAFSTNEFMMLFAKDEEKSPQGASLRIISVSSCFSFPP